MRVRTCECLPVYLNVPVCHIASANAVLDILFAAYLHLPEALSVLMLTTHKHPQGDRNMRYPAIQVPASAGVCDLPANLASQAPGDVALAVCNLHTTHRAHTVLVVLEGHCTCACV